MSKARRTIEIVDYDQAWPRRFADERDRIESATVGAGVEDEVLAIEHVGSTAVPGLAAKPILDLLIGIRRFPASAGLVAALEALGYVHHGEVGIAGRHYLTDAPPGQPRTLHLHVVEHGSWFWREHLRFRDHLRRHPEDATAYAELKRELAVRHRHDSIAYTEGKNDFVRAVLARAREVEDDDRIHPAAAEGFDAAPDVYERARPGYPSEAVDHLAARLGLGEGRRVVDVGAGTGKLTRELVPTGADVVAVEPVGGMRAVLADALPEVEVVDGTAEELPLERGGVDAVVAGQAFHWFEPWMALSEMHRVLREGGMVGLVWNVRDGSAGWVRRWDELVETVSEGAPRQRPNQWRDPLARTSLFSTPETATFPNPQPVTREVLLERIASTSVVAALPGPRRRQLLDDFRHLVDTDPGTRGLERITIPYRTEVHTFARCP